MFYSCLRVKTFMIPLLYPKCLQYYYSFKTSLDFGSFLPYKNKFDLLLDGSLFKAHQWQDLWKNLKSHLFFQIVKSYPKSHHTSLQCDYFNQHHPQKFPAN